MPDLMKHHRVVRNISSMDRKIASYHPMMILFMPSHIGW